MFSLSPREQFLIAAILGAVVAGAGIKRWRDEHRELAASPSEMTAKGTSDVPRSVTGH